jgi:hypothetical protein
LLENFIKDFQVLGKISSNYMVISQDDLVYNEVTADSLNGAVSNMKNYKPCKLKINFIISVETKFCHLGKKNKISHLYRNRIWSSR